MGSYHVNSGPEEVIDVIRGFAAEHKLGDIHISSGPEGTLCVRAGRRAWLRMRCLWICVADSRGSTIDLRVLPSLLRMAAIYTALCITTVGMITVGGLFLWCGIGIILHPVLWCGFAAVALGLVIFYASRYLPAVRNMLHMEREFAQRLAVFHPRGIRPPATTPIPMGVQIALVQIPIALLWMGMMRALPFLAVLAVPPWIALTLQAVVRRLSPTSPQIAWRIILSDWVGTRVVTCSLAFTGLSFFFAMGTMFTVAATCEKMGVSEFCEALRRPITYYESITMDQSVLTTNVRFLRRTLQRLDSPPDVAVPGLQRIAVILACLTFALTIWGMKGYIDWLRMWTLARQRATLTLGPPSVPAGLGQSAKYGLCAALAGVAFVNVLHLVISVDILSTTFADRYVISRVVGQSLGWALLDVEAAVGGIPQKSAMGVAVSLALASPTLLVFLGWTVTSVARVLSCRRRTHCLPVEPRLRGIVDHLASHIAVRPPTIKVADGNRLYLETILSWLPGKATLVISRSAFEELDACELEAAIAHELAHIKYDLPAVLVTRWLSVLSLFPCNVFALVLDTEKRELRADRAAASMVASSDIVRRAIAKTSLGSILVTRRSRVDQAHRTLTKSKLGQETMAQRLIRYIALTRAVAQPTFMLGYTHPAVADRLSALDSDSPERPA
jgi:Zn-dependent protease with chaperone function